MGFFWKEILCLGFEGRSTNSSIISLIGWNQTVVGEAPCLSVPFGTRNRKPFMNFVVFNYALLFILYVIYIIYII